MANLILLSAVLISCAMNTGDKDPSTVKTTNMSDTSIHQFKIKSLDGGTIDFSNYKGKKILVVNTASECGYTPQYKELETLYKKYQEKLVIVGVPSNEFGGQEPGSDEEIKSFCEKNYGVTFPMASKTDVKGDGISPLYKWLTNKDENGVLNAEVKWNFNKFLLDENGKVIAYFDSKVLPMSSDIIDLL